MPTETKAWYESTTVWINVAVLVVAVLTEAVLPAVTPADYVAPDWIAEAVILFQSVTNIALRVFRTNQPIR